MCSELFIPTVCSYWPTCLENCQCTLQDWTLLIYKTLSTVPCLSPPPPHLLPSSFSSSSPSFSFSSSFFLERLTQFVQLLIFKIIYKQTLLHLVRLRRRETTDWFGKGVDTLLLLEWALSGERAPRPWAGFEVEDHRKRTVHCINNSMNRVLWERDSLPFPLRPRAMLH